MTYSASSRRRLLGLAARVLGCLCLAGLWSGSSVCMVVWADAAPVPVPAEELLGRFRRHLSLERGLQVGTIENYEHAARVFLEAGGVSQGPGKVGR